MYYKSLQILRGWAALTVVLYHLGFYANALGGQPNSFYRHFDEHYSQGAWFFFGLSGFLMAYLVDTGYRRFLLRRLLRIYPTFFVAAIGVTIAKGLVFHTWIFNISICKALLLLPFGTTPTYPLGVEWTLVYEVFFYLVCSIFANDLLRRAFPYFLLGWFIWLVTAFTELNADIWFSPARGASIFLPTAVNIPSSFMNALFIGGGLIYYIFKRLPPLGGKAVSLLVALASLVYISGDPYLSRHLLRANPQYIWWIRQTALRISLLSISFGFIVVAACSYERIINSRGRSGMAWRFLERFGDCSYALYLIHVPIITVLIVLARSRWNGAPIGNGICTLALAAALVVGWQFGKFDVWMHNTFKKRFFISTPKPDLRGDTISPAPIAPRP